VTGGQVTTLSHFTDGIFRAGLNYQSHRSDYDCSARVKWDMIVVMARRRNITPRFAIEDEILAAPIASISDIAAKLEIITARAKLFDVSDDLERLHDQIVAFRACESLGPPACNWYAA